MSRQWLCDWCGARFDDREQVATADITLDTFTETVHLCGKCAPDWLAEKYPAEYNPVAVPASADHATSDDEEIATDGGTDQWRLKCWGCGVRADRRDLATHPVHVDRDDEPGYDVLDVYLCRGCRKDRMPTHECQYCGREYLDLGRAAECCQHRADDRIRPDGGENVPDWLTVVERDFATIYRCTGCGHRASGTRRAIDHDPGCDHGRSNASGLLTGGDTPKSSMHARDALQVIDGVLHLAEPALSEDELARAERALHALEGAADHRLAGAKPATQPAPLEGDDQ